VLFYYILELHKKKREYTKKYEKKLRKKGEKKRKMFLEKINNNTLLDDDEIDKKLEEYDYKTVDKNILGSYQHMLDKNVNDNDDLDDIEQIEKENNLNLINNENISLPTTKDKNNNDIKTSESQNNNESKEEKKVEIVAPKAKTKEEIEEEEKQKAHQEKLKLEREERMKRKKIWKNICSKEVPIAYKRMNQTSSIKLLNLRKISQLCQRETKRVAYKYFKMNKDYPYKCKRAMREMLIFWKRNEREEREARKRAEKEAQEKLRIEEEIREQRRQMRKLNFLITQTELYSHFVGKKIQGSATTDDNNGENEQNNKENTNKSTIGNDEKEAEATNFDEIDFDDDDEDKLKERAQQSAEAALKLCQEKTKIFDEETKALRKQAETNNNLGLKRLFFNRINGDNLNNIEKEKKN